MFTARYGVIAISQIRLLSGDMLYGAIAYLPIIVSR